MLAVPLGTSQIDCSCNPSKPRTHSSHPRTCPSNLSTPPPCIPSSPRPPSSTSPGLDRSSYTPKMPLFYPRIAVADACARRITPNSSARRDHPAPWCARGVPNEMCAYCVRLTPPLSRRRRVRWASERCALDRPPSRRRFPRARGGVDARHRPA